MSRQRNESEQKAVETILWALGHRLVRLKEEHEMKGLRGEEPPGVAEGLRLALSELNELLPRRRRVKP